MDRKRLEEIHFNEKMAEHDNDAMLARFSARHEATTTIASGFLDSQPDDYAPPTDFDNAAEYASGLLYRIGCPVSHISDADRAMENDLGRRPQDDDSWMPCDQEARGLVAQLVFTGSMLAHEDREPAYSPHIKGRNHEILDPPGTQYNKFGTIIL